LGFTLVELLVTIAIIGILAGLALSALSVARESARANATRATIAKLHVILMKRYESYLTRRIPLAFSSYLDTSGNPLSPAEAAQDRLVAIRDMMRMEMPDRDNDVVDAPVPLPNSRVLVNGQLTTLSVPRPAISLLYYNRVTAFPRNGLNAPAEYLYMIVSMGSPEDMQQFSTSEIADTDHNGYPEFVDGWGRPIFFLRWAPGFSPYTAGGPDFSAFSDIQSGNPVKYHDPFDTRNVDSSAFKLMPLIYSAGPLAHMYYNSGGTRQDAWPGLLIEDPTSGSGGYHFGNTSTPGGMFVFWPGGTYNSAAFLSMGRPSPGFPSAANGLITNHHQEGR
jgi:prepilin-type N-terminal cleavage/methylation domain-containing protein